MFFLSFLQPPIVLYHPNESLQANVNQPWNNFAQTNVSITEVSKGGEGETFKKHHLEGWDREGGREGDARGKRYGKIYICITDSLCYTAETNTPL